MPFAIHDCFRVGKRSFFSSLFRPRIDRILFAATKADHLHHVNHDRLEAIVKHMVLAQGGEIHVESVLYKGSTFSFTLPAGMSEPEQPQVHPQFTAS